MNEFKTKTLKVSSRASVKIGDSFYTFESTIEKTVPDDYTEEEYLDVKRKMWDEANADVDNQINDTYNFICNNRK